VKQKKDRQPLPGLTRSVAAEQSHCTTVCIDYVYTPAENREVYINSIDTPHIKSIDTSPDATKSSKNQASSASESRSPVLEVVRVTNCSTPPPSETVKKYALLATARKLLLDDFHSENKQVEHRRNEEGEWPHRTTLCHIGMTKRWVEMWHYPEFKGGAFKNLMHCACVWTCAKCAAKITERRLELYNMALKAIDGPPIMLTLTVQHGHGAHLRDVQKELLDGYTKMFSEGKQAYKWLGKWGIVGRSRAIETTYGISGWHPHLHVALDFGRGLSKIDLDEFQNEARERWATIIKRLGGYASRTYGAFVTVEANASYFLKLGIKDVELVRSGGKWTLAAEMTKSPNKKAGRDGLTPIGLLAAVMSDGYTNDDFHMTGKRAGELWIEYIAAMQGQKQLVASGTIYKLLKKLGDKTDEETEAEEREDGINYGMLNYQEFKIILGNDVRGELEDVIGQGDTDKLKTFLAELGIDFNLAARMEVLAKEAAADEGKEYDAEDLGFQDENSYLRERGRDIRGKGE